MTTNAKPPLSDLIGPTRDFCVAVFVIDRDRVLLHWHRKLGRWLPPGGHIDPNELPDEAAIREVREETGVQITLVGDQLVSLDLPGQPRQLVRPAGIQLASISPGHEHIDLVYFATGRAASLPEGVGWFRPDEWRQLELSGEVLAWCHAALARVTADASEPPAD